MKSLTNVIFKESKRKNIKNKILGEKTEKTPKKYYALLLLMLMLAVATLSNNIKHHYHQQFLDELLFYPLQ